MTALRPILEMRSNDPNRFENIMGQAMNGINGFTPVNEGLSYGLGERHMHIHVAPSETKSLKEKLNLIRTGLPNLLKL